MTRVALVLVLVAAPAAQDPAEETELSADKHLKDAEMAASADLNDKAFYHYERAIDTCPAVTDEQLGIARAGRKGLLDKVAANTDEKKALSTWRVLAVVCRAYNFKTGDVTAAYRLPDAPVKAVKDGLAAFEKAVWDGSRGAMKAAVTLMPVEEPVRTLRSEDDGFWMNVEEFERNFPKIKPRDGEFDQVFVYCIGDARNTIPFAGPIRWGGRWKYARYWNINLAAEAIKGDGEIELTCFLRSLRGTLERCAGYSPRLVPDAAGDPQIDCCRAPKGRLEWYRHILLEHVTSRMYAEAPPPMPQAPYLTRFVLVSDRYSNQDDKGLDQAHINELNTDADLKGWQPLRAADDVINVNRHFSGQGVRGTCYLGTYVYLKKARWARLMFGCTDHVKVIVNGVEAGRRTERPDQAEPDEWAFRFLLREGRNLILIKTASNDNPWQFIGRLTDEKGNALRAEITPLRK